LNEPVRIRSRPIALSRVLPFTLFLGLAIAFAITGLAQPVKDSASPALQATALVLVKAGTRLVSGTAVCIDGGGVFVTNAHTVAEARKGATVQLVLEAGENNQKVVAARLLEFEEASDLAVLKADAEPSLKPVDLASDSDLSIKESVLRLRYPGVGATATGYPRVALKSEVIVALPKDEDGHQQIQLDAPLGVKATEGAFFDRQGKLVGIAVRRQGPDRGIILPASRIAERLPGRVIVDLDPPAVDLGDLAVPRSWSIRLRSSSSGSIPQDLSVSVTLSAFDGDRRTYRAEPVGSGQYQATVIPLPPGADPKVGLISSYHREPITAVVQDTVVQVGGTPVRLGELAYIENGLDLRLMSSESVGGIPPPGENLVIVADVKGVLHFHANHANGLNAAYNVVTDETLLKTQAGPIADLKRQLESLRPPHELTTAEKDRVIAAVTSIVHALDDRPTPRAIKTDGTVLKGRISGLESVTFNREDFRPPLTLRSSQVGSIVVRPGSEVSPISELQVVVEVQRRGESVSRMEKRLKVSPASNSAGQTGTPQWIVPLPQPSEEREALLDVQGWLDVRVPRAVGAERSVRAPSVEIGNAQVSLRTTRPSNLELVPHGGAIWHAAFTLDGRQIMTAGHDGLMVLWDAQNGARLAHVGLQDRWARTPAYGRANRANSGEELMIKATAELGLRDGQASGPASGPDGRARLPSAFGPVRVWKLPGGRQLRRSDGPTGAVHDAVLLGDGRRAVSGDTDGMVRIWDITSGRELGRLDGHGGEVHSVAVAPDDRILLAGYGDGTIRLWDLETAQVIRTLNGHTGAVEGLAISPHGLLAVSCGGSTDNAILVWDMTTGRVLRRLKGHTKTVFAVAFSPDGQRIVSGCEDGTARVWELVDSDISSQTAGEPLVHDLGGTILDIVPGGGGRYLVLSLSGPHRLAVFDANTASIARVIPLPDEEMYVAAGASSFFVGFADRRLLEEWAFATLTRKRAVPLPIKGQLKGIALGIDSEGPLLAVWVPPFQRMGDVRRAYFCFVDIPTGKVLRVRSHSDRDYLTRQSLQLPAPSACLSISWMNGGMGSLTARLRARDDNRRFVLQAANREQSMTGGLAILDLDRDQVRSFRDMSGSLAFLSSDGEQVSTISTDYLKGFGEDLQRNPLPANREAMIPTCDPKYHLIPRPGPDSGESSKSVSELDIKNAGWTVATVSKLDEMKSLRSATFGPQDPLFDRRFVFIPAASLLITIPPNEGRLVLRRIDFGEMLHRPLRILRGEKPRKSAPEPSGSPHLLSGKGKPGVEQQESGGPHALIPDLNVILIVLTVLSYLAGLIQQALWNRQGTRGNRSREQKRRHRLVSALILVVATGLTLTCIAVEWLAYRNATAVNRLLEQRTEDSARPVLTLQELQPLIGRPPESSSGENGRIVASYSWKGIIRKYRLHLECAKGKGNDTIVTSYFFE